MVRTLRYRVTAILLAGILLFSCCGCGDTAAQQVIPEDIFAEELATDELVVYGWKHTDPAVWLLMWNEIIEGSIRVLKNQHGVDVTYREIPYDEYDDILTVDLMAGKGPDVILWENLREDMFTDPSKIIETGTFLNLDPLFAQDPEFSFDDYLPAIDAGLYKDGRYYVPLNYFVGTVITLEERLDNTEFPWVQYPTYDQFSTDFLEYIHKQSSMELDRATEAFSWFRDTYLYTSGLQLIDFETQTVLPDREGLQKVADFCKELYPYLTEASALETYKAQNTMTSYTLYDPNCAFLIYTVPLSAYVGNGHIWSGSSVGGSLYVHWLVGAMPTVQDSKPVAIPGISAAIRSSTPNLQNAYYYIKYLLSDTTQNKLLTALPVKQSRAEYLIDWYSNLYDRPEELAELTETLTDVEPYKQFSTKQWELFVRYMTPYWEENASYDQCVSELESMLELYMYE